ncbi:MAG: D-cysteine desulfhydrase [Acidimicrobiia bacterium]|nr:MAG: D-cysteine desulfhydrase [Acidimicrobiia bacterium]
MRHQFMISPDELIAVVARFPRVRLANTPTPIEPLSNLGSDLGISLSAKRDDYTGIGFGGNKVRQLEFYFGSALEQGADVVLITGAVQSNFARTAAAIARRLDMDCHIQLEERVPYASDLYRGNGNVLLDRLLGATIHEFPGGEDEAGADAALQVIAEGLRREGRKPFIIPLAADHPPLGALGYVLGAVELAQQMETDGRFDKIVLASGSSLTHIGLLFGLRALGIDIAVHGVCVRRDAEAQESRIVERLAALGTLMDMDVPIEQGDVLLYDGTLAPGYGRLNAATTDAILHAARREGLFLDPAYTGKAMAGLIDLARTAQLVGERILFWHTGGQPALFGYADQLDAASSN